MTKGRKGDYEIGYGKLRRSGQFKPGNSGNPHGRKRRAPPPFARGSLFHLLKNPIYCGKIVHKGKVCDGEHEPMVDADLWELVQLQLAQKAPPRKRSTNEPQQVMLRGLMTDPHGRPMVPTYGSSKVKRYACYETRKDLARQGDPSSIRFQRGKLEQHLVSHIELLLNDEHALRRLSGIEEAGALRTLFASAHLHSSQLREIGKCEQALRKLIATISIRSDGIAIGIDPAAVGIEQDSNWSRTAPSRSGGHSVKRGSRSNAVPLTMVDRMTC